MEADDYLAKLGVVAQAAESVRLAVDSVVNAGRQISRGAAGHWSRWVASELPRRLVVGHDPSRLVSGWASQDEIIRRIAVFKAAAAAAEEAFDRLPPEIQGSICPPPREPNLVEEIQALDG